MCRAEGRGIRLKPLTGHFFLSRKHSEAATKFLYHFRVQNVYSYKQIH